jgi:hypothetical protein
MPATMEGERQPRRSRTQAKEETVTTEYTQECERCGKEYEGEGNWLSWLPEQLSVCDECFTPEEERTSWVDLAGTIVGAAYQRGPSIFFEVPEFLDQLHLAVSVLGITEVEITKHDPRKLEAFEEPQKKLV